MKPTLQQTEILKTYLSDILKYRETIDEVYDHVLSAVEAKPENISFQDAVNDILNDDFGGGNGLAKMEKQHLQDAIWEGIIQMIKYVIANFFFPSILYTIILYVATSYAVQNIKINHFQVVLIFPLNALFFLLISWIRKFFVGYFTRDTRKSIQDIVTERIMYIPYWTLIYPFIFSVYQKKYLFLLTNHPFIIAGMVAVYILFVTATIKICLDEFKKYQIV
ncbi:MAG: hypothetical protein ACRYGB_07160 [Janthinobacterium lividum]